MKLVKDGVIEPQGLKQGEDPYQARQRLEGELLEQQVAGAKNYPIVLSRIADALEHQGLPTTAMMLAQIGRVPDGGVTVTGHLASCPSCQMLRNSKPASGVVAPVPKQGIILPS